MTDDKERGRWQGSYCAQRKGLKPAAATPGTLTPLGCAGPRAEWVPVGSLARRPASQGGGVLKIMKCKGLGGRGNLPPPRHTVAKRKKKKISVLKWQQKLYYAKALMEA